MKKKIKILSLIAVFCFALFTGISLAAPTSTLFTTTITNVVVSSTSAFFLNSTSTNFRFTNATGTNINVTGITATNVSSTNITNTTLVNSGVFSQGGIVSATGTIPTMGTCGTSPSVIGSNLAGTITVGSGVVTSCILNFASPVYINIPSCVLTINTSAVTGGITTLTTSSVTFSFAASLGGGTIYYICLGSQ